MRRKPHWAHKLIVLSRYHSVVNLGDSAIKSNGESNKRILIDKGKVHSFIDSRHSPSRKIVFLISTTDFDTTTKNNEKIFHTIIFWIISHQLAVNIIWKIIQSFIK